VTPLSGGASHRIALRDGETDTPTPVRSDLVPEESPPECRKPLRGGAEGERGQAQMRAEESSTRAS
jgi:hypothetical protein